MLTPFNLTSANLALPALTQIHRYDAVEIAPCIHDRECSGCIERVEEENLSYYQSGEIFWSVYLHYDADLPINKEFGGVNCVGDFPTKEIAEAFATFMTKLLEHYRAN